MTEPNATADPWYRRPKTLAVLAVVVLAVGVGVGLLLAAGEDDEPDIVDTVDTVDTTTTTSTTTAPPTTAPPPTTTPEDGCAAGDQVACDLLEDATLDAFCQEGNVDACQVLLARQGDGVPDGDEGEGRGNGNDGNGNGNGGDDEDDEDD